MSIRDPNFIIEEIVKPLIPPAIYYTGSIVLAGAAVGYAYFKPRRGKILRRIYVGTNIFSYGEGVW